MKKILFIVSIIIFVSFNCSDSDDFKTLRENRSKNASGDILIGAVASWEIEKDEYIWQALKMAVDEINEQGGIKGRRVVIQKEDDLGSLDQGLIIAEKFSTNPDMLAVLGHTYSYISIPCSILYQYNGMILLSPTSDHPELSNRKGYDRIFHPSPTSDDFVTSFADFLEKTDLRNIIIFNQNDVFGNRYGDYFEKIVSSKGISTVSRIPYSEAAPEIFFKNKLLACKYFYDFDALLIAGDAPSAGYLVNLCSKYNIGMPILGTERFYTKELIDQIVKTKERVIFPSCFDPAGKGEEIQAFVAKFKERFGVIPRSRAARWYNSVKFLAHAMKQSGELTPSGIIESIKNIKTWNGVIGKISFDGTDKLKIMEADIMIHTISDDGKITQCDTTLSPVKIEVTENNREK